MKTVGEPWVLRALIARLNGLRPDRPRRWGTLTPVRSAAGSPGDVIEHAVTEGMATAFERDFGGANRPWGEHPPEGSGWEAELLALPTDAPNRAWLFAHPDGRRWIGYRTGTAWVDRATAKSGRTSADLVATPTAEVLSLAGVTR